MQHSERIRLSQGIFGRYLLTMGCEPVLAGYYGSTSRDEDLQWSDLEMLIVGEDICPHLPRRTVVAGIAISIRQITENDLIRVLQDPTETFVGTWPFYMGALDTLTVLGDGEPARQRFLALGRAAPPECFIRQLQSLVPGRLYENAGRIRNLLAAASTELLQAVVLEWLSEIQHHLGLLNQSWVTHSLVGGIRDTFRFPLLSEGYEDNAAALIGGTFSDDVVVRLLDAHVGLLRSNGVQIRTYDSVEDFVAHASWPVGGVS